MKGLSNEAFQKILEGLNRLTMVEVKGDSVEHLFMARLLFTQAINAAVEIKEEEKTEDSKEA